MSDQVFWFATRSAGIVCWFAAAASVMVGLLIPTRALGRRPTIPWLLDLHRFFGAMSVLFLVVHMVTLWLDEFVAFRFGDLLVPFVASVPGLSRWSLALGVIGAWFLFAIEGSSLIKDRLPPKTWHTIHLTSFGVLISGAIHGLTTGSDADNRFLVAATTSVTMAILILAMMRAWRSLGDRKQRYADDVEQYNQEEASLAPFDDYEDLALEVDYVGSPNRYGRASHPGDDIPVTSGARLLDPTDPGPPRRPSSGPGPGAGPAPGSGPRPRRNPGPANSPGPGSSPGRGRRPAPGLGNDDEQPSWLSPPPRR